MSKHIFWLTSYPKSGNTLTRLIISALFFSKEGLINLELIKFISNFESTRHLNFIKTKNIFDFNNLDQLEILSKYFKQTQSKSNLNLKEDFGFFKTHYANIKIFNDFFTLEKNLRGLIYIIRDPRDVVVSWASFANITIDESVKFIINKNACINWFQDKESLIEKKIKPKVVLSSWGDHVISWINNFEKTPKLILRYEDIIKEKKQNILKIINFFETNYNIKILNLENKLNNIINTSNLENLREQEKISNKNKVIANPFFRVGKSQQWKKILTIDQNRLICENFGKIMESFGYL